MSAVAAGLDHTLFLLSGGQVHATGKNHRGQLGTNSYLSAPVPIAVPGTGTGGEAIASVSAGDNTSYAVATNGGLFAWGENSSGQLGNASPYSQSPTLAAVDRTGVWQAKPAARVSAGDGHVVALDTAGQAFTWGANSKGQLGDGELAKRTTPGNLRTHRVHFGAMSGPTSAPGLDVVADIAKGAIFTTTPAHAPEDVDVFVTQIAE